MEVAVTSVGSWSAGSGLLAEVHREGWVPGEGAGKGESSTSYRRAHL